MVETIFSSVIAQVTLIFVLVFTLVFAILQKTKILGDGKNQIDALVAGAIGLLVISVGYALDIIYRLIPFLVIGLVIILVFLLLLGSLYHQGDFKVPDWLKVSFGIVIFIAVVIAVMVITGGWDYISSWFMENSSGKFFGNLMLLLIVAGAIAVVLTMGKGGSGGKGK